MSQGRREESRRTVLSQAALVWAVGEMNEYSIHQFVKYGDIQSGECPMPAMPEVEKKVAEIMANGGIFVM